MSLIQNHNYFLTRFFLAIIQQFINPCLYFNKLFLMNFNSRELHPLLFEFAD